MSINEASSKRDIKCEHGFVFGLFPEESRSLYEGCITDLAEYLKFALDSTLDFEQTDVIERIWACIRRAEVILADITGFDPQVMCEVGMALGFKDSRSILLICSEETYGHQIGNLPIDLRGHQITQYEGVGSEQLRLELIDRLKESLTPILPDHPIKDLSVRKLVEKAMEVGENKDWVIADVLLEKAARDLPNNWYIKMQEGVLCRNRGELVQAYEFLKNAASLTDCNEHRAEVSIEQAFLEIHQKKTARAEALFEKARRLDKNNRRAYFAAADMYDKLGLPERALGQIADLMGQVGKDPESQLLARYYSNRLYFSEFSMSLTEFRRQELVQGSRSELGIKGLPIQKKPARGQVSKSISWTEFRRKYEGVVVAGEVRNHHPHIGVFVWVNREFKGLIHKKNLANDFIGKYPLGKKIHVRIRRIYQTPEGKRVIDLLPV